MRKQTHARAAMLIAVGAMLLPGRDVQACSCFGGFTYPADGAIAVPRGVEVVAPSEYYEPVLQDSTGERITTSARKARALIGELTILRPDLPLEPETEYQIVTGNAVTTFVTGVGLGGPTLEPPSIEAASMAVVEVDLQSCGTNSCSAGSEVRTVSMRYQPSASAAYYRLVFASGSESWSRLVDTSRWFGGLSSNVCGGSPPWFRSDDEWCAQLIAVAPTGAEVAGESFCTTVKSCATDCSPQSNACWEPDFEPGPIPPEPTNAGCSVASTSPVRATLLLSMLLLAVRYGQRSHKTAS